MLELRGLSVSYGQHRALEDVALRVAPGEIVVILGANGAGKSTLLKAVAGICEGRVAGSALMGGEEITGLPPHRIVEAGLALVPEGRGVFGDLTVAENLALGAHPERARDEEAGNLDRVLGLFPKLGERRRQVVRTMSGGEQQMVAIGRAMMSAPSLLMLDEPSLGLSPLLSKELFQALGRVRDAGLGILLVEQNARASLAIADRGYLLENGQIVHADTAERLRSDPAVQAAYLGGAAARPGVAAHPARPAAPATAPKAPAPRPAPAQPRGVARPAAGPTPDEIAARALAGLSAPAPRQALAPPPDPRPVPQPPPRPAAIPPRPVAQPAARGQGMLYGLSVDDLVAEATAASRARQGTAQPRAPRPVPPTPAPRADIMAPAAGGDRLKSVLAEIEDAAARARAWRPDPRR